MRPSFSYFSMVAWARAGVLPSERGGGLRLDNNENDGEDNVRYRGVPEINGTHMLPRKRFMLGMHVKSLFL